MKTHESVSGALALAVTMAMAASMGGLASVPASAQNIMASKTVYTSTTSTTSTTTTPATVLVQGTVKGAPENVAYQGLAKITANVVTDPDFGNLPAVVLSVDLGDVVGVGTSTHKKYVTATQGVVIRRLAAADTVEFSFPFQPSDGSDPDSNAAALVTFQLQFDVKTAKLTAATSTVASQ